jgi:hypothetical protein
MPGAGGRPGSLLAMDQAAPLAACSSFSITRSSEKLAAF